MTSIAPTMPAEAVPVDVDEGLEGSEARRWLMLLGVPFVVLIAALLVRPQGLLGRARLA